MDEFIANALEKSYTLCKEKKNMPGFINDSICDITNKNKNISMYKICIKNMY